MPRFLLLALALVAVSAGAPAAQPLEVSTATPVAPADADRIAIYDQTTAGPAAVRIDSLLSYMATGLTGTFQGLDDDLTAVASLSTTIFGRSILEMATPAAGRTLLELTIGTDVQAYDTDLADLADGSLSGSKVGTGISGTNVSTGTVADARIAATIARDSEIPYAVDWTGNSALARPSTTGQVKWYTDTAGACDPGPDNLDWATYLDVCIEY